MKEILPPGRWDWLVPGNALGGDLDWTQVLAARWLWTRPLSFVWTRPP